MEGKHWKYRWLGRRAIWQRWYHRAEYEGCLAKNKECRDVLDWSGLCKDASPHLSGFWCFFFCIISSSDDRIESSAILRHWLLAHDYGYSVFSEFDLAPWNASWEVTENGKVPDIQLYIHIIRWLDQVMWCDVWLCDVILVYVNVGMFNCVMSYYVMWCYYGPIRLCYVVICSVMWLG